MGFFIATCYILATCTGLLYAKECVTGDRCVKSCADKDNGFYQSCTSCKDYVVCADHKLYEHQCPHGQVWDDDAHNCLKTSTTCKENNCFPNEVMNTIRERVLQSEQMTVLMKKMEFTRHHFQARPLGEHASHRQGRCKSTGPKCVSDCTGVTDGDYQSCHGCGVYVSCVSGYRYDDRPCAPGGLVWDDDLKTCEWNSSTCHGCYCPTCPDPCKGTGPRCVGDCTGMADGDYQSCKGCDQYVSCVDGLRYDARPCAPGGTVWDDNKKLCDWYSDTCKACP